MEHQEPTTKFVSPQKVILTDMWGQKETATYRQVYARSFVVEHLHYSGMFRSFVDGEMFQHCIELADGFGAYDADLAEYFKGGFDWSHIRDSSWAAFEHMAEYLVDTKWVDDSFDAMIAKNLQWSKDLDISPLDFLPGKH